MKYKKSLLGIVLGLTVALISGCHSGQASYQSYKKRIDAWHQQRVNDLTQDDSWLSLAGLYWLDEGQNSFGSDSTNDIVFPPSAPDSIGTFSLSDRTVQVSIKPKVLVTHAKNPIKKMTLKSDASGNATLLHHGTLSWYIIKRGDRFGIRLKDANSETLRNFKGIKRFPVRKKWHINATYRAYDTPKTKKIPSVIGIDQSVKIPGRLSFKIDGRKFTLLPTLEEGSPDRWFIVFGDQTNGKTTYGGGRFLYVPKTGDNQQTYIDFNKAYNPPCAFTAFATCPLPPPENKLSIAIKAGEKKYGEHTHHH